MVEDVHDPKIGRNRKLLFLSSKQAGLVAQDPSAIDKLLAAFLLDKPKPELVISLLPSMIRSWMLVHPLPGDPGGEREGLAALDRFMSEIIIPLAVDTNAIILCSAVQPFCILSDSLSRMVKLVRARWGPTLPFTIISCTGHVPYLYKNKSEDSTWKAIRKLSKFWKERESKGLLKERTEDQDNNRPGSMDLDPNGTNFIMVDPDIGASASYDPCIHLVTEIARKLTAEVPSIAIKTGKSQSHRDPDAAGIEIALSNMEVGTPVLLLDLTKRQTMPMRPTGLGQNQATPALATTHPKHEGAGSPQTKLCCKRVNKATLTFAARVYAATHKKMEWLWNYFWRKKKCYYYYGTRYHVPK